MATTGTYPVFQNALKWPMALLFLLAIVFAGRAAQSDFQQIVLGFSVGFGMYMLLAFKTALKWQEILAIGLLARVALVFLFPGLSDDIYRFLWDGRLALDGVNPYAVLPSEIVERNMSGLDQTLFQQLNSPNYFTIYPPFAQLIFVVSQYIGNDVKTATIVMKMIFIVAEIGTFFGVLRILKKMKKPLSLAAIYFLNPLIVLEGVGNLHFEIIMIFWLCWCIVFFQDFFQNGRTRPFIFGCIAICFAVASKLLPLLFFPYFAFRLGKKKGWQFVFLCGSILLVLFSPLLFGLDILNFGKSVDLYFQKFEFNASVYYVLRAVGQWLSGYNLIHYLGPLLGLATAGLVIRRALTSEQSSLRSFLEFGLYAFVSYLFLATTVHPWYLAVPLFLTVFLPWRFVVLWSFLITLTYINYSYPAYYEQPWVIWVEYSTVFLFLCWEWKAKPPSALHEN